MSKLLGLGINAFKKEFRDCNAEYKTHGISPSLRDRITSLLENFQDLPNKVVKDYLSNFLPPEDINVFINFNKNIQSFGNILEDFIEDKSPSNDSLRDYFFNSKHVNSLLLSDEYREILDYIQNDLTQKVKVELYMDIQAYFLYGCYEQDKRDPIKWPPGSLSSKQKYERIKALSEQRNIGVLVKKEDSGRYSIQCGENQLSKNGLAKAGYIDRVKITPSGLVVMLGTSDGSLSLYNEPTQLREHIKALSVGISNGELNYNGTTYTKTDICDISFNILTKTKTINYTLQTKMQECGLNSEAMRFLNTSFAPFLAEPGIDDYFKYNCSMNGIACSGLDKTKLEKLEEFILETLKNINSNTRSIEAIVANYGGRFEVLEYFKNFAEFLDQAQRVTDFSNHKKILKELKFIQSEPSQIKEQFPSILNIGELINGFSKERQTERRATFLAAYKAGAVSNFNLQNKLKPQSSQELEHAKFAIETEFNVDPLEIREILIYNKVLTEFKKQNSKGHTTNKILDELLVAKGRVLRRDLQNVLNNENNSDTIKNNAIIFYQANHDQVIGTEAKRQLTAPQALWLKANNGEWPALKAATTDVNDSERKLLSDIARSIVSPKRSPSASV